MNRPANIVLLIEDESKIRRFLRAGFELQGYSVIEAENAADGLKAATFSAPDLTHLMTRRSLAAGTLVNNPGNLAGWVQNPQNIKPDNLMPNQFLSAQQLSDALAYLETLK